MLAESLPNGNRHEESPQLEADVEGIKIRSGAGPQGQSMVVRGVFWVPRGDVRADAHTSLLMVAHSVEGSFCVVPMRDFISMSDDVKETVDHLGGWFNFDYGEQFRGNAVPAGNWFVSVSLGTSVSNVIVINIT